VPEEKIFARAALQLAGACRRTVVEENRIYISRCGAKARCEERKHFFAASAKHTRVAASRARKFLRAGAGKLPSFAAPPAGKDSTLYYDF